MGTGERSPRRGFQDLTVAWSSLEGRRVRAGSQYFPHRFYAQSRLESMSCRCEMTKATKADFVAAGMKHLLAMTQRSADRRGREIDVKVEEIRLLEK
jgi:hypothetical protein